MKFSKEISMGSLQVLHFWKLLFLSDPSPIIVVMLVSDSLPNSLTHSLLFSKLDGLV